MWFCAGWFLPSSLGLLHRRLGNGTHHNAYQTKLLSNNKSQLQLVLRTWLLSCNFSGEAKNKFASSNSAMVFDNFSQIIIHWGRGMHMRQYTMPSLVQIMACRLFGAKPLPKPILPFYQLDPKEHISVEFYPKFKDMTCKMSSAKWRPCISALMC